MISGFSITPAPPKTAGARNPFANGRYVLSASQITTFASCRRKWAWRYVARVPEAPNASAELGGRVHSVLEAWLASGVAPDPSTREGRIALVGLKHLPPPGSGYVEHGFLLHTPRNTYIGYIDFQGFIDGLATILDHKTTGNLMWAKTAEDLETDIQALIYAVFGFLAWGVDHLQLKWVYYTTSSTPRSPAPVVAKVRLPVVMQHFEAVEALGEEISYHALNKTHPMALQPNANTCSAYGGCPHVDRCGLTDEERFRSLMSDPTMEQKLGGVPVFDATQPQQSFPQWTPPQVAQPQPQPPQPTLGQPVFNQGDQRWYAQDMSNGQWVQVNPPQQNPAMQGVNPNQPPPMQVQVPPQVYQPPQQPAYVPPQQQAPQVPAFNPPQQAPQTGPINSPEGPSEAKRGRPAGAKGKKLEKLTSDRIAFLAGVHAAVMSGSRDSAQLQAAGEAALLAFTSKFGE